MTQAKPCLAIVLVDPTAPNHAASYHWCKLEEHVADGPHVCYCGIWWLTTKDDLVPPTPEMILWRTGSNPEFKSVGNRLMG